MTVENSIIHLHGNRCKSKSRVALMNTISKLSSVRGCTVEKLMGAGEEIEKWQVTEFGLGDSILQILDGYWKSLPAFHFENAKHGNLDN